MSNEIFKVYQGDKKYLKKLNVGPGRANEFEFLQNFSSRSKLNTLFSVSQDDDITVVVQGMCYLLIRKTTRATGDKSIRLFGGFFTSEF